jgi:hypothetical protein
LADPLLPPRPPRNQRPRPSRLAASSSSVRVYSRGSRSGFRGAHLSTPRASSPTSPAKRAIVPSSSAFAPSRAQMPGRPKGTPSARALRVVSKRR